MNQLAHLAWNQGGLGAAYIFAFTTFGGWFVLRRSTPRPWTVSLRLSSFLTVAGVVGWIFVEPDTWRSWAWKAPMACWLLGITIVYCRPHFKSWADPAKKRRRWP